MSWSSVVLLCLGLALSACLDTEPERSLAPVDPQVSVVESGSIGCNYSWGAPTTECTGGVREWKGGCPVNPPNGITYGGVPWSGNASQWWSAGASYRASSPGAGYIVVFGPSAYNHNYGHVGVVTYWDVAAHNVWFKSRNWRSGDYTGTVAEYLAACGCQLYGYLAYF